MSDPFSIKCHSIPPTHIYPSSLHSHLSRSNAPPHLLYCPFRCYIFWFIKKLFLFIPAVLSLALFVHLFSHISNFLWIHCTTSPISQIHISLVLSFFIAIYLPSYIVVIYRVSQKNMGIQWRIRYRLCYELA